MQTLLNTPHEIIQQNILGAAAKAKTRILNILVLGMMAGSFIAMGAQSSSLAVHNISNIGLARTLAGCIFPVGLMMIVFVGGELFTGDCMMSMAWMQRKIHFADMLRTLVLVYVSNFVGAALIAFLVAHSGQYDYSFGALGAYSLRQGTFVLRQRSGFRDSLQHPGVCGSSHGCGSERHCRKSISHLFPDPGIRSIRV